MATKAVIIKKRRRARRALFAVTFVLGFVVGNVCEKLSAKERQTETEQRTVYEYTETAAAAEDIYTYMGEFKITAYCACVECCGEYADGLTATGVQPIEGVTVAVDPAIIPYGATVVIDGNEYIAQDCGGAIKGNCIDIFFDDHNAALEYGKQIHSVYIMGV